MISQKLRKFFVYRVCTQSRCLKQRFVPVYIPITEIVDEMAITDHSGRNFAIRTVQISAVFVVVKVDYVNNSHCCVLIACTGIDLHAVIPVALLL